MVVDNGKCENVYFYEKKKIVFTPNAEKEGMARRSIEASRKVICAFIGKMRQKY